MITTKNYFAEANKIGIKNLPDTFQKSHELVNKVTENGGNWEMYNSNATIKKTIDLYFEKLTDYQKNDAPMPSIKKIVKAMPDRVMIVKPSHGKSEVQHKLSVWDPNGKKQMLSEKEVIELVNTILHYDMQDNDAEPIADINVAIKAINDETDWSVSRDGKTPKNTVKKQTAVKTTKPKRAIESKGTPVERIDDEITLIKRYVNFHDKQKTRDQVTNLLKAVQKAILEKRVNKNSQYGKEVMQIQDSLIGALKHDIKIFDIKIEKKQLEHYATIATGVTPMASIQLLKRYVGLQNKTGILDKVIRLRDDFYKWDQKNKLSNDKYYKYYVFASNSLNDYIQEVKVLKNANAKLANFTQVQLNGLGFTGYYTKDMLKAVKSWKFEDYFELIEPDKVNKHKREVYVLDLRDGTEFLFDGSRDVKKLSRTNDFAFGVEKKEQGMGSVASTIIAAATGGVVQAIVSHSLSKKKDNLSGTAPEVMSVADVKAGTFKEIGLTGDYLKLIGKACAPTSIFMYGNGGSGKSSLSLKLADQLCQLGHSVLYIAGEQYGTPLFQELINKVNIKGGDKLKIVKYLNTLPIKNFDVIVIDSKEAAGLNSSADFVKLRNAYPDKIWIITSQGTKAGDFAGDGKWRNEVDTLIFCEKGKASTMEDKNRWGAKAEIQLF